MYVIVIIVTTRIRELSAVSVKKLQNKPSKAEKQASENSKNY